VVLALALRGSFVWGGREGVAMGEGWWPEGIDKQASKQDDVGLFFILFNQTISVVYV
jgi:hypothetical protein